MSDFLNSTAHSTRSKLSNNLISLGYFLAPLILFTMVFHEVFLFQATFSHDALFWYPNFNYFINCLAQGVLPLWDPYSFAGAPFYLNHTLLGALDPLVLLFVPLVKYLHLDLFTAYQASYLLRFLVFYSGCYLLISSFTRNRFAVSAASHWALFALGTCAFRQNGYLIMMTYAPLFLWAIHNFCNRVLEKKESFAFFSIACITAGLTFNLYLPLYFLLASLIFGFLLLCHYKTFFFVKNLQRIPLFYTGLSILLFFGLICPTLSIFIDCFKTAKNEVISLTRSERLLESGLSLFANPQILAPEWRGSGSWQDLWAALIPGFYSPYFIFPANPSFTEHFFSLPIILSFLFFYPFLFRHLYREIPYVFISCVAMAALVFLINPYFLFLVDLLPGLRNLRQLGNFFGYFIVFIAIIYAMVINSLLNKSFFPHSFHPKNLSSSFLCFLSLISIFYVYLLFSWPFCCKDFLTYLPIIVSSLFIFYTLVSTYVRTPTMRYALYIILLTTFNSMAFSLSLKQNILTPKDDLGNTPFDQVRPFTFEDFRYGTLPRPRPFTGFPSCLFLKSSLFNYYPNSYIMVSRKTMDAIRFFPIKTLKAIKAFRSNILAVYDKPLFANDLSESFLRLTNEIPSNNENVIIIPKAPCSSIVYTSLLFQEPERIFNYPWQYFDKYDIYSFQDFTDLKQKDFSNLEYDDLLSKCLFISYGNNLKTEINDSYIYGPFFSSQVSYIENSFILGEHNGSFFSETTSSDQFQQQIISTNYKLKKFQRSYNDKLFNMDLSSFNVVVAFNNSAPVTTSFYKVLSYDPNSIHIKYFNKNPSWFYFADSYFPGWKCFDRGQEIPINYANFCFKAAFVEKTGETDLKFIFRPQPYTFLFCAFIPLSISCFGYLLITICFLLYYGKR